MQGRGKEKPISAARRLALDVLRRVEAEGAFATLALDHALERHPALGTADRALTTQLVYGTLRWRRRLDYALAAHSHRPLERIEPQLLRILRLTAYQLLFLDRIPEWAAVDEATSLAVSLRGKRAAGFVNAIARSLAGGRDRIRWPDPGEDPVYAQAIQHSYPRWLVRLWRERLGPERTEKLLAAGNQPAPLWIRANTLKGPAARLVELLGASGMKVEPSGFVPDALRVDGLRDIGSLAAHEAGWLHVQDAGAQAVCQLVGAQPGERVLDACAAPGGKSATLAQLMENRGEILAIDRNPARLGLVRQLADRLGIGILSRQVGDLNELEPADLGRFDRVLLDAPCSALGVLRRHPEGKWRLQLGDLERMARLQAELLDAAARLVKPGGCLIFSVCTLSQIEGPELIRDWLTANRDFALEDPRREKRAAWHKLLDADGCLGVWPDLHDMDGFFAARLRRATG